jgi:Outer membrane protein beta-barrel domain
MGAIFGVNEIIPHLVMRFISQEVIVKNLLLILIAIALVFPASADAQEKSIAYGIKGGINLASLRYEGSTGGDDFENKLGMAGGVTFGSPGKPGIGFDIDLLYVQCGAKQTYRSGMENDSDIEFKTKLDYAECAPMLRFVFGETGGGPYLLAGGFFGYLLKAEITSEKNGEESDAVDMKDNTADLNYGLTIGVGLQTGNGQQGGLFFEARYVHGLADILDTDENSVKMNGYTELKTKGIYGFIGMRF